MNLQDQIGAIDVGVDQLIQAASAAHAPGATDATAPQSTASTATPDATSDAAADAPETAAHTEPQACAETEAEAAAAQAQPDAPEAASEVAASAEAPAADARGTLEVGRPAQNEITMTINGQTVSLHPMQVSQLIEELANVRASMQPEPPAAIPPGWRFASTKNPMMAVQKQSNGDRLLVMRHTGHGWVPFTFSPDMVVQMYMMLTQR
ncbi:hypothetical protein [Burkholderia sp. Ax-1719]|uniref:hypothetical protein n=1 Tax=Burkholderia sp. Ax-1719 TaxID=2608334 RepID=UPI0014248E6B|nr:hypothetical protein [Burkholderia sp. Ax-1719]NIE66825.1 hypothetical protein [Burkholderia sp. Ax-1719]